MKKKTKTVSKAKTKPKKSVKVVVQKKVTKPEPHHPFSFKALDGVTYKLTLQQKMFVELYLSLGGNGTQAIIDAGYDVMLKDKDGEPTEIPNYKLAAVMASENLRKPNICAFINSSLEKFGYTDQNIERHHLFLINQFSDLKSKAKGIDLFYKVKGKYPSSKVALEGKDGEPLVIQLVSYEKANNDDNTA